MKRKATLQKEINRLFSETIAGEKTKPGYEACGENEDGTLYVTSECGHDSIDGYGEFRGGIRWVNPKLETLISKAGWRYEWAHFGAIYLYKD